LEKRLEVKRFQLQQIHGPANDDTSHKSPRDSGSQWHRNDKTPPHIASNMMSVEELRLNKDLLKKISKRNKDIVGGSQKN